MSEFIDRELKVFQRNKKCELLHCEGFMIGDSELLYLNGSYKHTCDICNFTANYFILYPTIYYGSHSGE